MQMSQTFASTPRNYTVIKTALNAAFAAGTGNFQNVTVTYSDITNKYTFTTDASSINMLAILATSTINSVLI